MARNKKNTTVINTVNARRTPMIFKCDCKNFGLAMKFQDEKYGIGMRVFNPAGKETPTWRCTICGKTK